MEGHIVRALARDRAGAQDRPKFHFGPPLPLRLQEKRLHALERRTGAPRRPSGIGSSSCCDRLRFFMSTTEQAFAGEPLGDDLSVPPLPPNQAPRQRSSPPGPNEDREVRELRASSHDERPLLGGSSSCGRAERAAPSPLARPKAHARRAPFVRSNRRIRRPQRHPRVHRGRSPERS